jgi:hypothetical protein
MCRPRRDYAGHSDNSIKTLRKSFHPLAASHHDGAEGGAARRCSSCRQPNSVLRRAVRAAAKEKLVVTGYRIEPDGTICIHTADSATTANQTNLGALDKMVGGAPCMRVRLKGINSITKRLADGRRRLEGRPSVAW